MRVCVHKLIKAYTYFNVLQLYLNRIEKKNLLENITCLRDKIKNNSEVEKLEDEKAALSIEPIKYKHCSNNAEILITISLL